MSKLTSLRQSLAARRADGNYDPLAADLVLAPRRVQVLGVSPDDAQVLIAYEDGLTEWLGVAEISSLTPRT